MGKILESDIQELKKRVYQHDSKELPKEATVITCTNLEVNKINKMKLEDLQDPEEEVNAIIRHQDSNFDLPVDSRTGQVIGTPLQKKLILKVKARIMLTSNIDVMDNLTNGSFGEIVGFQKSQSGQIQKVLVHFDDPKCGENLRSCNKNLSQQFPDQPVTPISAIEFPYRGPSSSATVFQFPLKLAFATTSHKVTINIIPSSN